jgi:hypothetical protein
VTHAQMSHLQHMYAENAFTWLNEPPNNLLPF